MSRGKGKLYWLKLMKDFFKRHDSRIIESAGTECMLFYLKLLCESLDHSGKLRFSDELPYDNAMLAVVTNTSVETVDKAMKVLEKLKLLEIQEDGTIFMTKVQDMTGSETKNAQYMRESRARQSDDQIVLGDFKNVVMTEKEYEILAKRYPDHYEKYIDNLSAYKESKGVTYNNDYATLIEWLLKDIGDPLLG